MKKIIITSFDKTKITCYLWDKVEKPKAVVQIFHGMAEHAKRYDDFAKFLNKKGFIVFADDHRGHGETAGSVEAVGKYNREANIYYDTVQDEIYFSKYLIKEYHLPLIVFGHSYGSLIAQRYIQSTQTYSAAILCGSNYMKNSLNKIAKSIAKTTMRFKGNDAPAKLIEKLSFGAYNKKTDGCWITFNQDIAKKYKDDPYCGTPFSAKFYYDMLSANLKNYKFIHLKKIAKNKPLFLIAGKEDLFSNKGKGVIKLYKLYKGLDIDVKMKLYDNMRHEVLNESNNKEVYNDIINFINESLKK